jgi:hypothetical protein
MRQLPIRRPVPAGTATAVACTGLTKDCAALAAPLDMAGRQPMNPGPTTGRRGVVVAAAEGLSSSQAAARLVADGANVLPARHRVELWRRVLLQLRDPLVLVLLAAAVLTVATGDWADAAIIALVVVVNTTVSVAQEVKADRAITALSAMAAPEARVLRDGTQRLVPAADVVIGDLVCLPRATSSKPTRSWRSPRRCWSMRRR